MTYNLYEAIHKLNLARMGLGVLDYNDLIAQAGLRNCDPRDSACVADNVSKQAQVEDYWVQHMATGVPDGTKIAFAPLTQAQVEQFYNPKDIFNSGNVVPVGNMTVNGKLPSAEIKQGSENQNMYYPKLTFTTSSGSTVVSVGDTWKIDISGGKPESSVYVVGGKGGANDTVYMGRTDSGGNFSLSGAFDNSTVGEWKELWTVGGVQAGNISFVVGVKASTTESVNPGINSQTTPATLSPSLVPSGISEILSGIPEWALIGGAVLIGAMFLGGRR